MIRHQVAQTLEKGTLDRDCHPTISESKLMDQLAVIGINQKKSTLCAIITLFNFYGMELNLEEIVNIFASRRMMMSDILCREYSK